MAAHAANALTNIECIARLDAVVSPAVNVDDVAGASHHLDLESALAREDSESLVFAIADEGGALDRVLFGDWKQAGAGGTTGNAAGAFLARSSFAILAGTPCTGLLIGGTEHVQVGDHERIAWVDPVRVGDVSVGVPKLGP